MSEPRFTHTIIGGNIEEARQFGLTLIAKCGKVFVPLSKAETATWGEVPPCEVCELPTPHRLAGDPHVVYRCYDSSDRLLYVGCTWSPKNELVIPAEYAFNTLGLSGTVGDLTGVDAADEDHELFCASNTIQDVRRIAESIAGERL